MGTETRPSTGHRQRSRTESAATVANYPPFWVGRRPSYVQRDTPAKPNTPSACTSTSRFAEPLRLLLASTRTRTQDVELPDAQRGGTRIERPGRNFDFVYFGRTPSFLQRPASAAIDRISEHGFGKRPRGHRGEPDARKSKLEIKAIGTTRLESGHRALDDDRHWRSRPPRRSSGLRVRARSAADQHRPDRRQVGDTEEMEDCRQAAASTRQRDHLPMEVPHNTEIAREAKDADDAGANWATKRGGSITRFDIERPGTKCPGPAHREASIS